MKKSNILFEDVYFSYDKYMIDEECNVSSTNDNLIYDILHSSNGYDYILLKSYSGRMKPYRLDKIMAFIFLKKDVLSNTKYDYDKNPLFEVIHIDNNTRNNSLSNLKVVPFLEKWVDVIYPENVVKGLYEISNYGRIRNKITNKELAVTIVEYKKVSISSNTINGIELKAVMLHRLIALHFIQNPNPDILTVVDHINGNKLDCRLDNLQWVSHSDNCKLANITGLNNLSKISTREVDIVITLLLELKGSIKAVYNSIDHNIFPNITEAVINNIKHKDPAYIRMDGKYDLRNIQFEKRTRKPDLTNDEIEMICQKLVECNFDIGMTLKTLHSMGLTHLEKHDVRHIRDKSKRCDISDKYFQKTDYERPREPLNEQLIVEICKALVECDGNISKALELLHEHGFDIITKYDIQDIKYKKKKPDISDMFFTYENKEFNKL